jgi:hypothetical protein
MKGTYPIKKAQLWAAPCNATTMPGLRTEKTGMIVHRRR